MHNGFFFEIWLNPIFRLQENYKYYLNGFKWWHNHNWLYFFIQINSSFDI